MKTVYPDVVLVRGKAVVDDGQIVGKAGYREYRTPQKAAKLKEEGNRPDLDRLSNYTYQN